MTAWLQTYSGIRFELDTPTVAMVSTNDIARALFSIIRFNSHIDCITPNVPWTVGHHSLAVAQRVADWGEMEGLPEHIYAPLVLQALLHDAAEAYIGDITKPLKSLLQPQIKIIEDRILQTIFLGYHCKWPINEVVLLADEELLVTEAEYLCPVKPLGQWHLHLGNFKPLPKSFLLEFADATPIDYITEITQWYEKSRPETSIPVPSVGTTH